MKKIFVMLAACAVLGGCSSREEDRSVRIAWDAESYNEITSFDVANKGYEENDLYYPRIRTLSDGSLLMSFMNHKFGWDIFVTKSYDGGRTWAPATMIRESGKVESPFGPDIISFVNPDFLELQDGRIIIAYQGRYLDNYHNYEVTNDACWIEVMWSDDKGLTWSEPREVYRGRCWEPAFIQLPSGELQMYITDSGTVVDNSYTLTCTAILRSFDGGMTWQNKDLTRQSDLEPIAADVVRGRRLDGMASAVRLNNGDLICPLEVYSHIRIQDQTPVLVRTSEDTNWKGDYKKILEVGGPEFPYKRQLNKDFYGYAPYCCILPTGEPLVASNGKFKGESGFWVLVGDKKAEVFSNATSPFAGFWGNIAYIGGGKVMASATVETKKDLSITDNRSSISPNSQGWKNPADNILGFIRTEVGYLNYSKVLSKGDMTLAPVEEFDGDGYWFLGHSGCGKMWADFGYTDSDFIFASYIFDRILTAYMAENGDSPVVLLNRGKKGNYKIVANAAGLVQVSREEFGAWHIIYNAGDAVVQVAGTLNDSSDSDLGYSVKVNVPWNILGGVPRRGEVMRAHLRHNYKDGSNEKPQWEYEDAEGENSDYPEEWLSITLK